MKQHRLAAAEKIFERDIPHKDNNRDRVLEVLRRYQPISRVSIARISGLQRSTISAIVEGLLKERWIREGSILKTARGRRPTMLTMNDDLVISVADVRPTQAILAIVDLNGRLLARTIVPLINDPKRGVEALGQAMKQLREQFPEKICVGAGISLPGRVNSTSMRLALAPNLPWVGYDIREALQKKLQLQVELENAANACMLSEVWFGRIGKTQNAVLITISEGVGAAIFVNGKIIEGADGIAGELGHIPLDESGPMCGCGQNGCWEMFASSRAALRYYEEQSSTTAATVNELMSLEASGNKEAKAAIERQALAIGRGLRIVTAAFNPEMILFAGDITLRWEVVGPIIEREVAKRMLAGRVPKIVALNDGESARLRGAAALVLQRHTSSPQKRPT